MKTREFNVPANIMIEFAEALAENELTNEITGTTEDNEVVIEVQYEKSERQAIFELMEMVDDAQEEDSDED